MTCISKKSFYSLYQLGEEIGRGTYGVVYKAVNVRTGKPFVVKEQVIRPDFIREVCILSQFTHPNIVTIRNICIDSETNRGLIAMPMGESTYQAYHSGKITMREILTDLFSGLSFLNNNGIAHCDLKDANTIYDPDERRVKIIDMGYARFGEYLKDEKGENTYYITGTGYTEIYRSPIYFRDHLNNINVELYSLAFTLYYLQNPDYKRGIDRTYYLNQDTLKKFRWSEIPEESDQIANFIYKCQFIPSLDELSLHPAILPSRLRYQSWSKPNFGIEPYIVGEVVSNRPEASGLSAGEYRKLLDSLYLSLFTFISDNLSNCEFSIIFLAFDIFYRFLRESPLDLMDPVIKNYLAAVCCFIASSFTIPACANFGHTISNGLVTDRRFQILLCHIITVLNGKLYNHTLAQQSTNLTDIVRAFYFIHNSNYISDKTYLFNQENTSGNNTSNLTCGALLNLVTKPEMDNKFIKYRMVPAIFEDDYCTELKIRRYDDILLRPKMVYNLPVEEIARDSILNVDPGNAFDKDKIIDFINKLVRYSVYFDVHTIGETDSINVCKLLLDNYTRISDRLSQKLGVEIKNSELFRIIYSAQSINMNEFYDYNDLKRFEQNYPFSTNMLDVPLEQIYRSDVIHQVDAVIPHDEVPSQDEEYKSPFDSITPDEILSESELKTSEQVKLTGESMFDT